jgi:chromosome transmission fidelity protein 8
MNMSSIPLHTKSARPQHPVGPNPMPLLLQTPSGLALLELQGTINLPEHDDEDSITSTEVHDGATSQETPIGRLIFPEYDPQEPNDTSWMKRVYLYVGKHQRLTGEVKKLPKAIAIIRKRDDEFMRSRSVEVMGGMSRDIPNELEIVEIVKWKILFSTRPEPVGTSATESLVE